MARVDLEIVLDSIKTIMVDNFNNKLAEITAEKNDGLVLPEMVDAAYILQTLDERITNYSPFIVYGIIDIENIPNGPQVAEKLIIEVVIVLDDNGREEINRVLYRYLRSLREIFEEGWQIVNQSVRISVTSSTIVPFQNLDSSAIYKAVGVQLEITLP